MSEGFIVIWDSTWMPIVPMYFHHCSKILAVVIRHQVKIKGIS